MRLLDKRLRLFGLVNLLDLAIVVAVVIAVVAGYWFVTGDPVGAGSDELVPIEYVLLCNSVLGYDESWIVVGDTLSRKGGRPIGMVESVEVKPAVRETVNSEGEIVLAEAPLARDVYIVVRSEAEVTALGYLVDGDLALRNNMNIEFVVPGFIAGARIVSIQQLD